MTKKNELGNESIDKRCEDGLMKNFNPWTCSCCHEWRCHQNHYRGDHHKSEESNKNYKHQALPYGQRLRVLNEEIRARGLTKAQSKEEAFAILRADDEEQI